MRNIKVFSLYSKNLESHYTVYFHILPFTLITTDKVTQVDIKKPICFTHVSHYLMGIEDKGFAFTAYICFSGETR